MRVLVGAAVALLAISIGACSQEQADRNEPDTTTGTTTAQPAATSAATVTAASQPTAVPPTTAPSADLPATITDEEGASWNSPTRNIFCAFYAISEGPTVECGLKVVDFTAPPESACDLDSGDAIELVKGAAPRWACHGDPAYFEVPQVLAYGASVTWKGLRCVSEQSGMTCSDMATGHSFKLARASYSLR